MKSFVLYIATLASIGYNGYNMASQRISQHWHCVEQIQTYEIDSHECKN